MKRISPSILVYDPDYFVFGILRCTGLLIRDELENDNIISVGSMRSSDVKVQCDYEVIAKVSSMKYSLQKNKNQ